VNVGQWYDIATGIGLILAVIKNPDGLVGPVHGIVERRRQARLERDVGQQVAPPSADPAPAPRPPVVADDGQVPLLTLRDVTVRYGVVVAVDAVSFEVEAGSIVGLIGPNGAGKTTLMDAVCGFTSARGEVTFGGAHVDGLAPHRRARHGVARTFQGLDLYDDLTVSENVAVGQYVRGREAPDTDDLLRSLGLEEHRDRHVRHLSQGQRQLVSVARALAGAPRLLLLDEPAAGLDTTESLWLAERLRGVRDRGVTILLVDHDMHFVLGLCDRIHVLDFGKQIASGTPGEIRTNTLVAAAYLGAVPTEATP
jgi:sulfate-transporting ATPase